MFWYGVGMMNRPIIVGLGNHYEENGDNYVTYTIWFNNLWLKWMFYFILFKTKILLIMFDIVEENQRRSTNLEDRLSSYLFKSNQKLQSLTLRLKYTFFALVVAGFIATILMYSLGNFEKENITKGKLTLIYLLGFWNAFNLLLNWYLTWFY